MAYRFEEGYFSSANQVTNVYYCRYLPERIKGVVLLLHGMGSHAARYRELADILSASGYAVYAYDLVGHGKSVSDGEAFGTFAEKNGDVVLVKDLFTMTELIRRRFRMLPFFAFGHSLGSFILRAFVAAHPNVFDGIILSGTAKPMTFSFLKRHKLQRLIKKAGRKYSPEVERLMLGGLVAPFLQEEGSWLTTRPESLPNKRTDPYVGHKMKADAYGDIFKLLDYISSDEWLDRAPRGCSILFLSGERDPLGGSEIEDLAELLKNMDFGKIVCKIYRGEKHELLGSLSNDRVVGDLIAFLDEETEAVGDLRRQRILGGI